MTRLRIESTDHNAEAAPQTRTHPSTIAVEARARRGLGPLADATKPAAHIPATETTGTIPLGTTTRSGKNSTAAAPRPASHQAAIRRAVRSEVNRDRADGALSSAPINVDT
jgi:hypothetical protein